MATHLKIVVLTCLLSPMVLMEDVNPVMLKNGERLRQRTKKLEESMRELTERMKEQDERMEEQEGRIKKQEETIKALEECKACSKIKELNETLSELQENINPKPDECVDYKVLDEADRSTAYTSNSSNKCDDGVGGWYRIMGKAGDKIPERTPEECVPIMHCGADAPGWLNGKHPSLQEGVVTREVCYRYFGDCCFWKNNIKIRNCGSFYVYELQKPPQCRLRYCGEGSE